MNEQESTAGHAAERRGSLTSEQAQPLLLGRALGRRGLCREVGVKVCAPLLLLALLWPARHVRADDWFGPDKALHYGISVGLSAGGYAAGLALFDSREPRLALGFGFAVTLGAGKELYDLAGHGDPSWRDFTWDLLGAVTGALLAWMIDFLLAPAGDTPTRRPRSGLDARPIQHGPAFRCGLSPARAAPLL